MLIEITRMCNENCTHCMRNALPDGPHMNEITFKRSIQFAIDNEIKIIILSGGDPILHPDFGKFINYIHTNYKKNHIVMVESNGWWIEDKKMVEKITRWCEQGKINFLHIATHQNYYPNYEFTKSHERDFKKIPNCMFYADWQGQDTHMKYSGRARDFMNKDEVKGVPGCLNYVNLALGLKRIHKLQGNIIRNLTDLATSHNKNCSPFISVEGNIHISELIECQYIGNINQRINKKKFDQELFAAILDFKPCNRCNCMKNLTDDQRSGLDMLRIENYLEPYFYFNK